MADSIGEMSEDLLVKQLIWKIPNFSSWLDREDITSPAFRFANATWYLRMHVNALYADMKAHVTVELVRSQSSVHEHRIRCTATLKTERDRTKHVLENDVPVHTCFFNNNNKSCGIRSTFLECERLTIYCQMRHKEEATLKASSSPQEQGNNPSHTELQEASSQTEVFESVTHAAAEEISTSVQKLQLDYNKLLKSEEDSDVCLKVSDKEFRAHRCILKARSTVFSAMFNHDTKEKASGEVVIDDLEPESFSDFLQYVYAGSVESLSSKKASSLYTAADKYDLQELKTECREYMRRTLSVDTFCDAMILAIRYREEELLKLGVEFFSKNLTKIIVTVKWQAFARDYYTEANELLIKALVPGEKSS